MNTEAQIESMLFFKSEPVEIKNISELLEKPEKEIRKTLDDLENNLSSRGIRLMRVNDSVMLSTAPETSAIIEKITKEELSKEIGKAGLETLSIILYKG